MDFSGQVYQNGVYVVSTPIGNMGDISLRALYLLNKADYILCEDTRQTLKLLDFHNIKDKKLLIYNNKSSGLNTQDIINLANNCILALVSDAGTPLISDPGVSLISSLKRSSIGVFAVPGACSLTAALSVSGLDVSKFVFFGFFSDDCLDRLKQMATLDLVFCFFENPKSLPKMFEKISQILGNQQVVVCRELTKRFEDVVCMNLLDEVPDLKGEIVVLIDNKPKKTLQGPHEIIENQRFLLKLSTQDLIKFFKTYHQEVFDNLSKSEIYDIITSLKEKYGQNN